MHLSLCVLVKKSYFLCSPVLTLVLLCKKTTFYKLLKRNDFSLKFQMINTMQDFKLMKKLLKMIFTGLMHLRFIWKKIFNKACGLFMLNSKKLIRSTFRKNKNTMFTLAIPILHFILKHLTYSKL